MDNPKTCFIIVTFETPVKIVSPLLDLLTDYRVYLVDNSSEAAWQLKNQFSKDTYSIPGNVRLITVGENRGFAAGVNIGLTEACKSGYDWMTILNPDIILSGKSVAEYVKKLNQVPVGIAGVFPGYFDPQRFTTITGQTGNTFGRLRYLSGAFLSVHRDVVEKTGFLYEPYFLYYEDAEYCLRAEGSGFSLTEIPFKDIQHDDASGLGKGSYLHHYYLARNHLLFVRRNAPSGVKLHELIRLPKTIMEHWRKGESGALAGINDFIFCRFGKYKGQI